VRGACGVCLLAHHSGVRLASADEQASALLRKLIP
jgi:AhpD family alkylhydroperoxidase